ncbi:MAG: ATP-binding protein, partial [Treponema sp.]
MSATYDAGNIQVLKGLEAVRKRPGMYIGSTGPKGLHHLVYEVIDNSIDEAMAGFCDTVTIALEKNDIVRVEDNGRGIPVDIHPTEHISALELVLTRLHAGGKFDKGSYKVSGGLHGVGVSCVNALSTWMEAFVFRDGFKYCQRYEMGVAKTKVEKVGEADGHGTMIRWKADKTIFTETTTYDFDVLAQRLRELAFLNSGIKIIFRDERLETPKEVIYKFAGGIKEYVLFLNEGKPVVPAEPIYITGEQNDVITELSMQYNDSYNENIHTFVNDINTRDGGTHLEGFKSALTSVLNKSLDANDKLKKKLDKDEKLTGEDVRAGLTAILSMKVPEPEFEGQTKEKLGNTEVRTIVD